MCLCHHCHKVANKTEILVLQHTRERDHPFGTVRIAMLTLQRIQRQVIWGAIDPPPMLSPRAALLYPSEGARDLSELPEAERPDQLIVIDGTWSHANVIYRENPWLRELPALALRPKQASRYRIRVEPELHCVSTIESLVQALALLEPDTPNLDHPLFVFEQMIDQQLQLIETGKAERFQQLLPLT